MAGMKDLMREYERARFPQDRRLDLHGEGPAMARERARQWIQSRAHETPGEELLLIVERTSHPGRGPSALHVEVRKLLEELEGQLIEWWQPFAPGSIAVKISRSPRIVEPRKRSTLANEEGRTPETAGAARPPPHLDIPPELLAEATIAAETRIDREGLTIRVFDVVLREVWYEAQALAMEQRISFEAALVLIRAEEQARRSGRN
jgi:hypothetical protein